MATGTASIGVRDLRADLATTIRRAESGQRIVVRVGGRPAAVIGPVENAGADVSVEALVAAGLLVPSRRHDEYRDAAPPVPVWSGVRLDRALREVRG